MYSLLLAIIYVAFGQPRSPRRPSSGRVNWLHACWGLGASISPFIMSYALASGVGWSSAYLIVGLIQAGLTFALLISIPLWGKVNPIVPSGHADESDGAEETADPTRGKGRTHIPLARAIRIPGVIPRVRVS